MSEPKLRIAASGLGGSGYKNPVTGERVVGVTTALGVIDKPGIRQWVADNTAAYAVANIDSLLNRTEDQGYRFLRWYWTRMKPKDFDDPEVDIRDYHVGVLNDAAELGTLVHEWVEADLNEWFEPDIFRDEHAQMITEYLAWRQRHEVTVLATEATVFGTEYGGTGDIFWVLTCLHEDPCVEPETAMLVDTKTSRNTWDEHIAQLAALGAADTWMKEVPKGTPGAYKHEKTKDKVKEVSWWMPTGVPAFTHYGILHVRPDDWNSKGEFVPAFCKLKVVPQDEIDVGWEMFQGALTVRKAQARMKAVRKERQTEEEQDD